MERMTHPRGPRGGKAEARVASLPSLGGSILTPLPSLPASMGVTLPRPGPFLQRRPSTASPGWGARDLPGSWGTPAYMPRSSTPADPTTLAARGESSAAFDRRCIPPGCVAPRSHTAGIFSRRALPAGRLTGLGASLDFHHGLLGARPSIPVGRARGSCELQTRSAEKSMPRRIGDDVRRGLRPQPPRALRVAAAWGHLPRCASSPMRWGIASSARLAAGPTALATRPTPILGRAPSHGGPCDAAFRSENGVGSAISFLSRLNHAGGPWCRSWAESRAAAMSCPR